MRKGRRRSSFSVAGGSSKKISTLRDLGKKVAAGYKSQISQLTPQHLNLLATPPHFRTRTDLIQLAEALQVIISHVVLYRRYDLCTVVKLFLRICVHGTLWKRQELD